MAQLDLFRIPPPTVIEPCDPNVIESDQPRLTGQNAAILDRLRNGPATLDEIIAVSGSRKHTSRISDLRAAGHQIECERRPGGNNLYRLIEH